VLWGTPARAHRETLKEQAMVRRVPELVDAIRRMAGGKRAKTHEKDQKDDPKTGRA
jgi:hypothetical protein